VHLDQQEKHDNTGHRGPNVEDHVPYFVQVIVQRVGINSENYISLGGISVYQHKRIRMGEGQVVGEEQRRDSRHVVQEKQARETWKKNPGN
jgi:hypothetical protein